ncbi:hypothetical protein Dimus_017542 [Dionaea muscipula]
MRGGKSMAKTQQSPQRKFIATAKRQGCPLTARLDDSYGVVAANDGYLIAMLIRMVSIGSCFACGRLRLASSLLGWWIHGFDDCMQLLVPGVHVLGRAFRV